MKQEEIFLAGEGEAWLRRNKDKLGQNDPVVAAMVAANLSPKRIFEVGCSNGWRFPILRKQFNADIIGGIDPAVFGDTGGLIRGTAARIPIRANTVDALIYGFCLYLCDREDLFKIVAEGDRVLQDGGYLIVHDFLPSHPVSRAYHHHAGVTSYKMDYAKLWLANPAYRSVWESTSGEQGISILKKDLSGAWPHE